MKLLSLCSIFLLICTFSIQRSHASSHLKNSLKNLTREELEVLDGVVKSAAQKDLSNSGGLSGCKNLHSCDLCYRFKLGNNPHKVCLYLQLFQGDVIAYIKFTFDQFTIVEQEVKVGVSLCLGLPKPFSKFSICLEVYNVKLSNSPRGATVCFRTELSVIFPLLSIDFNCLKYEEGKGIFYDIHTESESEAFVNVNFNGGHPIVSFNTPNLVEDLKSVLKALQKAKVEEMKVTTTLVNQAQKSFSSGSWGDALISAIALAGSVGTNK